MSKRTKRLVRAARALEQFAHTESGNDEPVWLVPDGPLFELFHALDAFDDVPDAKPSSKPCRIPDCPNVGDTSYRMVSEETGEFFCDVDDMPMALCPEHFREMLEEGLDRAEREISELKVSKLQKQLENLRVSLMEAASIEMPRFRGKHVHQPATFLDLLPEEIESPLRRFMNEGS